MGRVVVAADRGQAVGGAGVDRARVMLQREQVMAAGSLELAELAQQGRHVEMHERITRAHRDGRFAQAGGRGLASGVGQHPGRPQHEIGALPVPAEQVAKHLLGRIHAPLFELQPGQRERGRGVVGLLRQQGFQQRLRCSGIVHLPAHAGQRQQKLAVVAVPGERRLQHGGGGFEILLQRQLTARFQPCRRGLARQLREPCAYSRRLGFHA